MTFPEAGIQVLEKAGRPLLIQEIVAQAIQDGLLSHVGQIPEQTMRERLSALARRSADRKLVVVGPGQFALTDWGLPEDPEALAALDGPNERADEKPLRGKERHPPVSKGSSRTEAGREQGSGRNKKKKRLPPLSAVAADLLGQAGESSDLDSLLARGREKGLMSDDLSRETLLNALTEENRRRTKSGQSALFEIDGGEVTLIAPEALEPQAASIPGSDESEKGRGETGATSGHAQTLESRRQAARQLKRRVQELSGPQVERLALLLLSRSGYRDPRPARLAGGEHERLFILRRRLGLTEFRFLCQVLPVGREVSRESLQLLREWLPEAEAHAALVIGPGEATREARTESQRTGQPLLMLLCADAFIEELVLRQVGILTYEAVTADDLFWRNFRRSPDLRPKAEGSTRAPERSARPRASEEEPVAPAASEPAAPEATASESAVEQSVGIEAALPASTEPVASEPAAAISPAEMPE